MREDATHTVSLISYVLHLIDGWEASHFSYRIRTVILAAVLYLVTFPLWFFFILPGWLAWAVISIWFLYRIVLGWVRLNKQQPMDA
jgi:uncharacterized membrane protein